MEVSLVIGVPPVPIQFHGLRDAGCRWVVPLNPRKKWLITIFPSKMEGVLINGGTPTSSISRWDFPL